MDWVEKQAQRNAAQQKDAAPATVAEVRELKKASPQKFKAALAPRIEEFLAGRMPGRDADEFSKVFSAEIDAEINRREVEKATKVTRAAMLKDAKLDLLFTGHWSDEELAAIVANFRRLVAAYPQIAKTHANLQVLGDTIERDRLDPLKFGSYTESFRRCFAAKHLAIDHEAVGLKPGDEDLALPASEIERKRVGRLSADEFKREAGLRQGESLPRWVPASSARTPADEAIAVAKRAVETFRSAHPEYKGSDKNMRLFVWWHTKNGLRTLTVESLESAYAALRHLLTLDPSKDARHGMTRLVDLGGRREQIGVPPEIAAMPSGEFWKKVQSDAAFREAVEELGS